ncbi:MAG: HAMP domain-containing sensor histidine kinase, partial [Algoriphagus sp.]|nr:HAMP domain-containing sensor histidine kinase [Algoriphagus sp.]
VDVFDNQVVIVLEDNGIGIEERHRSDVFNLFSRATQRNVGTGLGLYMVKEAVEQMGGKIHLESQIHEGTTVTVTLPSMN